MSSSHHDTTTWLQQPLTMSIAPPDTARASEEKEAPLPSERTLRMRHIWCWINIACCIWSILLTIEILYTVNPLYEREGSQEYLIWSFGTTAIWCVEIGCNVYEKVVIEKEKIGYVNIIEGILALYFLGESIDILWTWNNPEADFWGELLEAALNVAGYAYLAYTTADCYGPARREQVDDDEEVGTAQY